MSDDVTPVQIDNDLERLCNQGMTPYDYDVMVYSEYDGTVYKYCLSEENAKGFWFRLSHLPPHLFRASVNATVEIWDYDIWCTSEGY